MREILFRGKKTGTNEWVNGSLISVCGGSYIEEQVLLSKSYEVDNESVCQYIGLKDKNGTKIFEGDILKIAIIKDSEDEIEYKFGSVEFSTRSLEYIIRSKEGLVCSFGVILNGAGFYEFELEVIGNIYDNKELLKQN